uniref:RuBisCO large subunit-binding protein subunit beta, chloroplastic n=1 Tax=Tanacetum cinerariifolium TaxID=118510 RepID=A0A6L2KFZ0_TANCI|nr:RuBisCO large subunit-binding protein subunit beta, chloroplastic [Tanacetum cinerariifolium]
MGGISKEEMRSHKILAMKEIFMQDRWSHSRTMGKKLNERIVKLSGRILVIRVGAQTETELKEKKLKVEDALNATKVLVGGGCTLLRLATKVDNIKETLGNDELKVGSKIVKRALGYPMKLITYNVG